MSKCRGGEGETYLKTNWISHAKKLCFLRVRAKGGSFDDKAEPLRGL